MDLYVLAMVLEIGRFDIIIKPVYYIQTYAACEALKESEEKKPNMPPLTCMKAEAAA